MPISKHVKLLALAVAGWAVFVVVGGPSYFQAWSFRQLLNLAVASFFGLGYIIYRLIDRFEGNKAVRSFWVAFYISVPVMILDYVYITLIRAEPFELFNRFWILSVFYIIPWIQALFLYLYISFKDTKGFIWGLSGIAVLILAVILKGQWAVFEGGFFDLMSDEPERRATMLGSALKYGIYGSALSASLLSFGRFAKGVMRRGKDKPI